MDIVEKLSSSGQLTQEQAQRVRKNVYEFMKHASEDPEFHRDALAKLAQPGMVGRIGEAVLGGLLLTGAVAGIGKGISTASKFVGKYQRDRDFKKNYDSMLATNPSLKNHDVNRVKAVYNTLHTFNPAYADDPLVAGTFIQNAMDMDRVDVNTINAIVLAREKLRNAESKEHDVFGGSAIPSYAKLVYEARSGAKKKD